MYIIFNIYQKMLNQLSSSSGNYLNIWRWFSCKGDCFIISKWSCSFNKWYKCLSRSVSGNIIKSTSRHIGKGSKVQTTSRRKNLTLGRRRHVWKIQTRVYPWENFEFYPRLSINNYQVFITKNNYSEIPWIIWAELLKISIICFYSIQYKSSNICRISNS